EFRRVLFRSNTASVHCLLKPEYESLARNSAEQWRHTPVLRRTELAPCNVADECLHRIRNETVEFCILAASKGSFLFFPACKLVVPAKLPFFLVAYSGKYVRHPGNVSTFVAAALFRRGAASRCRSRRSNIAALNEESVNRELENGANPGFFVCVCPFFRVAAVIFIVGDQRLPATARTVLLQELPGSLEARETAGRPLEVDNLQPAIPAGNHKVDAPAERHLHAGHEIGNTGPH